MCYSNFVRKMHRFLDIRLKKMSWPWSQGQRSLKVIESGTIRQTMYGFLLLSYSNFVRQTYHFWDIRLQKCCELENWVKDP